MNVKLGNINNAVDSIRKVADETAKSTKGSPDLNTLWSYLEAKTN